MVAFEIFSIFFLIIFVSGFGFSIFTIIFIVKKIVTHQTNSPFRFSAHNRSTKCIYCSQIIRDTHATHCPSCGAAIKGDRYE